MYLAGNMHEVMLFCLFGHMLWHQSLQDLYRAAWMLSLMLSILHHTGSAVA